MKGEGVEISYWCFDNLFTFASFNLEINTNWFYEITPDYDSVNFSFSMACYYTGSKEIKHPYDQGAH